MLRSSSMEGDQKQRLCIKIKLGHAPKDNDDEVPRVCHICNKSFSSRKTLGGHMRVHSTGSDDLKTMHRPNNNNKNDNNAITCSLTCCQCRKSFPSMKSLSGHMRSHPEREWRGIQPPSPPSTSSSTDGAASSDSSTSSTSLSSILSDDSDSKSDSAATVGFVADLTGALSGGWSVTAKRGRKGKKDSGLQPGIGDRIQEAMYQLVMLVYANPEAEAEAEDGDLQEEKSPALACEEGTSKRKLAVANGDQVDSPASSPTKKLKIAGIGCAADEYWRRKWESRVFAPEKSLILMDCEYLESESDPITVSFDGECVTYSDPRMKKDHKENENHHKEKKEEKEEKRSSKVKLTESETGTVYRYTCSICNKSFPSHQALGGHRSSHYRSKSNQVMDESGSAEDGVVEKEEHGETETEVEDGVGSSTLQGRGYQCNICGKSFPTGQALGGHKRCHWTGNAEAHSSAQAMSPEETSQSCPKILNFDLNEPPAMDGEEDLQ